MIKSAKTNATTPPKLIPLFHSTAASGTLPIEHTKLSTPTRGPSSGPVASDRAGCPTKKKWCQKASGTHAASAPATRRPMAMSCTTAVHSMTKMCDTDVRAG